MFTIMTENAICQADRGHSNPSGVATTAVWPRHRFYFTVEAGSIQRVIADELPSYHIACQSIRRHARATGNEKEVYYIRLFRRKNHKCWSVLQCRVRFREDKVLITGARYIEQLKAA